MKFCLSAQQSPEILVDADEIRITQQNLSRMFDISEKYPNATIVLNCMSFTDENFKKDVKELAKLIPDRLILVLFNFADIPIATQEIKAPYFMARPVSTLEEARAFKDLGVCYLLINGLLMHQLHYVKQLGIPLRAIPNIAHLDDIPRQNGIYGNWIRPENIDDYGVYIDTFEFGTQTINREKGLYRIYKKNKEWIGELANIVQDLNFKTLNASIPNMECLTRMNCEMRCKKGDKCDICYQLLAIARPEMVDARLAQIT